MRRLRRALESSRGDPLAEGCDGGLRAPKDALGAPHLPASGLRLCLLSRAAGRMSVVRFRPAPHSCKISPSHRVHTPTRRQPFPAPSRVPGPSHRVLPIPVHTCCYFFHVRNFLLPGLPLPVAMPFPSLSFQNCVCPGSPVLQLSATLESMSTFVDFAPRVPLDCSVMSQRSVQWPVLTVPLSPIPSVLRTPLLVLLFSLVCWISFSLGSLSGGEPRAQPWISSLLSFEELSQAHGLK